MGCKTKFFLDFYIEEMFVYIRRRVTNSQQKMRQFAASGEITSKVKEDKMKIGINSAWRQPSEQIQTFFLLFRLRRRMQKEIHQHVAFLLAGYHNGPITGT